MCALRPSFSAHLLQNGCHPARLQLAVQTPTCTQVASRLLCTGQDIAFRTPLLLLASACALMKSFEVCRAFEQVGLDALDYLIDHEDRNIFRQSYTALSLPSLVP